MSANLRDEARFGDIFRHQGADPHHGELVLYLGPADHGLWAGMIVRSTDSTFGVARRPVGTIYSDWVSINEWVLVDDLR